jgi:hypothetical protein
MGRARWLAGAVVALAAAAPPAAGAAPRWDHVAAGLRWAGEREFTRMLGCLLRGGPMGVGQGWFRPGQGLYGWKWLAARYDVDHDGVITRAEFTGPAEFFDRLDRDGDGRLTAADFDFSDNAPTVRQARLAEGIFRRGDANSDGRISSEEWQALFRQAAQGKSEMTPEDLRRLLFPPAPPRRPGPPPDAPSLSLLLRGLFSGEIGSWHEGPGVGQPAPPFRLPTQDGRRVLDLEEYRGGLPLVLVFGSFT